MIPPQTISSTHYQSIFSLDFQNNHSSHQNSNDYSLTNSHFHPQQQAPFPLILSRTYAIDSNISIDIKDSVKNEYLCLTERGNGRQDEGSFRKQYSCLLQKFKNRGNKFYKLISVLRQNIQEKNNEIASLHQHLANFEPSPAKQRVDPRSSCFTRKLLESKQTLSNRSLSITDIKHRYNDDQSSGYASRVESQIVVDNGSQEIIRKKSLHTQQTEVSVSPRVVDSVILRRNSVSAIEQLKSQYKLAESLKKSYDIYEEFYQEEETFRKEDVDLVEETIGFFEGKLGVLEDRIGDLVREKEELEEKLREKDGLKELKKEKMMSLEYLVQEQNKTIFYQKNEIELLENEIVRIKEEVKLRVGKLSEAFIKLNKQNRNLATKNYSNQSTITEQTMKIFQLNQVNTQLLGEIQSQQKQIQSLQEKEQTSQNTYLSNINILNKQLQVFRNQNQSLLNQITQLQTSAASTEALQQKLNTNSSSLPLSSSNPSATPLTVNQLEQQIQTLNYKMQIINTRYYQTCDTNKQLADKIKTFQKQILSLTSEIIKLQSTNLELRQIKIIPTINHSRGSSYSGYNQHQHQQQQSRSLIDSCSSVISKDSEGEQKQIVKYYQDEAAKLNKIIRDSKVLISDRDTEIIQLKCTNQSLNVKLLNNKKSLEQYHQNYNTQQNNLKSQLFTLNTTIFNLESQITKLQLAQQQHQLTDQYQFQTKIQKLEMEGATLKVSIRDVERSNWKLKEAAECAEERRKEVEGRYQKEKKYCGELERRVKQMEEVREQHGRREMLMVELEQERVGLVKDVMKQRMEIHLLNNALTTLKIENQNKDQLLQRQRNQFFKDKNKLNTLNKQLQDKVNKFQDKQREQDQMNILLTAKVLKMQSHAEQIKQNLDFIECQHDLFKSQQKSFANPTVQMLESTIRQLQQKMQGMTDTELYISTISRKDRLIKKLQQTNKQLLSTANNNTKTIESQQSQQSSQQIQELKSKIQELSKQLEDKSDEISQLQRSGKKLNSVIERYNTQLIEEQLKYGNLVVKTEEMVSELEEKNQTLKNQILNVQEKGEKEERFQHFVQSKQKKGWIEGEKQSISD